MKFFKGLFMGTLFGFAVGAALNEQQRQQITRGVKQKTAPVVSKVKDNVSQVADTVVDEVNNKIDDAGDAVAEKVSTTN